MAEFTGTYLLARIHKGGELTDEVIRESIVNPKKIIVRKNAWSFIEVTGYKKFIYGQLVKYSPEGEVTVVDEGDGKQSQRVEPNLMKASSHFVYIPEYSGLCFLKISNHVNEKNFPKRFSRIIKETNSDFFVDCEVEMISDLKGFMDNIRYFTNIKRINAKVYPTNPLFSQYWGSLDKYLKKRNVNNFELDETSSGEESLSTKIKDHIKDILADSEDKLSSDVDITDAALLLAIDGYGKGKIEGNTDGVYRTLDTSKTTRNFQFKRDPEPEELYQIALKEFISVNEERGLSHNQ